MTDYIAHFGHNIYTSHKDVCGMTNAVRTIHIYRNDMPQYHCDLLAKTPLSCLPSQDMAIEYQDGESLEKWKIDLNKVATFFDGHDPVLVHCAVGQTRSPTLAIVGLVARGMTPFRAAGVVLEANWTQRKIVSNLCITPLQEIFTWWDKR